MTELKPMRASEYRAHAETVKAERPTEIIKLKSGSVFELRRPDLQAWVLTGRVPQSLLDESLKSWEAQGKVPVELRSSSSRVVTDGAIFSLNVVQECTVNPRLVEFPDPEKNEIGPLTMLEEDFQEIFSWAMTGQGVAGVGGLRSFSQRRPRRTNTKSRRKKLQPEAVSTAAN